MSTNPTTSNVVPIKPGGKKPKKPNTKTVKKALDTLSHHGTNPGGKLPMHLVKEWEPTPEDRHAVRIMAAGGMSPEQIGKIIHPGGTVSASTIRRKFKAEIDVGATAMNNKVIQVAFQMATSGKNAAMTRFWLVTRCGWVDTSQSKGKEETDSESVAKRMRSAVKTMADTMPKAKTGTS